MSRKLNIFLLQKICQGSNIGGTVLFVEVKDINICVFGLTAWPPPSRIDLMTVTASPAISEICNSHSQHGWWEALSVRLTETETSWTQGRGGGGGRGRRGGEGNLNSDWFCER